MFSNSVFRSVGKYLFKGISFILVFVQGITGFLGINLTHTIELDESRMYQTFETFGTSSAWWSDSYTDEKNIDYIAKMLYSEDGLNLDTYRYNIGGGSADITTSRIQNEGRKTESFYVYNETTDEYEYDFTKDATSMAMLDKAIEYGASEIILFCNSPHYSMTINGDCAGPEQENVSNLAKENYAEFVDYMLTIADWFVEQGYPIVAISPLNEPQWSWGGNAPHQEGCHYELDECVELMQMFALEMQERGCKYELSGLESGQMSIDYWKYFEEYFNNEIINDYCDTFSGHSYWIDGDIMGKWATGKYFNNKYADKKFEMSEWCELPQKIDSKSIESGLHMANILIEDLTLLNTVSWQSWTAVNGDGVINAKLETLNRFYAYKQFSNFIEKGMVRIKTSDNLGIFSELSSVAFKNEDKTILVVVNDTERAVELKLANEFEYSSIYQTSKDLSCELIYDDEFENEFSLSAQSITTFVFE